MQSIPLSKKLTHYRHTLEELGKRGGMLGAIFRKAQNRIQDPARLRRLITPLAFTDTRSARVMKGVLC